MYSLQGIPIIMYQGVLIILSSKVPGPGKERFDIVLIKNLIPIAANPAKIPIIIATIIIKVCSVSFAFSMKDAVRRENPVMNFDKTDPIVIILFKYASNTKLTF